MDEISIQQLLDTGAHFGHLTRKWHPKMEPYIFMEKNSIHLIDLSKTKSQLEDAVNMVSKSVSEGGTVLFVPCRPRGSRQACVERAPRPWGRFLPDARDGEGVYGRW